MPAKTRAADAAPEAPAGHYLVHCARPGGFRRGGRAWEGSTAVPAAEMTDELLAALRGDAGGSFTVSGPHPDAPAEAG